MVRNTFWSASGLHLLLFNIFICGLFMFLPIHGIANYADDNTPYSTGNGFTTLCLI